MVPDTIGKMDRVSVPYNWIERGMEESGDGHSNPRSLVILGI